MMKLWRLCETHARPLSIFLSQRQWINLQAKFWNIGDELSGVNLKKPKGLLKFAKLLTHKNNWKGQCRQGSCETPEEKVFVARQQYGQVWHSSYTDGCIIFLKLDAIRLLGTQETDFRNIVDAYPKWNNNNKFPLLKISEVCSASLLFPCNQETLIRNRKGSGLCWMMFLPHPCANMVK